MNRSSGEATALINMHKCPALYIKTFFIWVFSVLLLLLYTFCTSLVVISGAKLKLEAFSACVSSSVWAFWQSAVLDVDTGGQSSCI